MATSLQGFMQPRQQDPLAALLNGAGAMPDLLGMANYGQGVAQNVADYGGFELPQWMTPQLTAPGGGLPAPVVPGVGGKAAPGGFWGGMLGSTDNNGVQTQGWGGLALGAAQALGSAYMGMKQYGLAKDSLAQSKKEFALNYDAQRNLTNSQLADRQAARVSATRGVDTTSVDDYMSKYGVPGRG